MQFYENFFSVSASILFRLQNYGKFVRKTDNGISGFGYRGRMYANLIGAVCFRYGCFSVFDFEYVIMTAFGFTNLSEFYIIFSVFFKS